jgi:hypothetical protein
VNVAVTPWVSFIVTEQLPVMLMHAPLQPLNVDPAACVAVSVTTVPDVKAAEHVAPQLMPEGALVIVPAPVPFLVTLSVSVAAAIPVPSRLNV